MAKLAPLQPVSSHPEVSLADEQSGAAAKCTMPFLEGKRDDEAIYFHESPFKFGDRTLQWTRIQTVDGPSAALRLNTPRSQPIDVHDVLSVPDMLANIIAVLGDGRFTKLDAISTCKALAAIYSQQRLRSTHKTFFSFHARNADWQHR